MPTRSPTSGVRHPVSRSQPDLDAQINPARSPVPQAIGLPTGTDRPQRRPSAPSAALDRPSSALSWRADRLQPASCPRLTDDQPPNLARQARSGGSQRRSAALRQPPARRALVSYRSGHTGARGLVGAHGHGLMGSWPGPQPVGPGSGRSAQASPQPQAPRRAVQGPPAGRGGGPGQFPARRPVGGGVSRACSSLSGEFHRNRQMYGKGVSVSVVSLLIPCFIRARAKGGDRGWNRGKP